MLAEPVRNDIVKNGFLELFPAEEKASRKMRVDISRCNFIAFLCDARFVNMNAVLHAL